MSNAWFYAKGDQRHGPVSVEQLRQLAASGQLSAEDLLWSEGMTDWVPATRVRGLFEGGVGAPAPAPAAPHEPAAAQPATIGYYSTGGGLSPRTTQILRGYGPISGPRDEWPLADHHLSQLAQAEKFRKRIRGFASLCRGLGALSIILAVVLLIGALNALSDGGRSGSEVAMVMLIVVGVVAVMSVLYFLCGRAAMRCRIWGPIVLVALWGLSVIACVVAVAGAMSSPFVRADAAIGPIISCVINGLFIFSGVSAMTAIPRFLDSPVWIQEALVHAKL